MTKLRLISTLLLLPVFAAGCALKPQRVNIASPQSPEVMVCFDALQKSFGIAPIKDERPPVEKAGDKPGGIFLLLWNQRIGNYISGDKDFLDPAATAMPDQIGRSISRSNCFFETKILKEQIPPQPSAEDLLIVLAKEKVDYVLSVELKHFYGQQHQKAYLYLLPAFFVNFFGWGNQAGNAEGRAEMVIVIYETQSGNEVFREKVFTQAYTPVAGAYPQAAQDAFTEASQKISNYIYRFAQLQQGSPVFQPEQI